MRSVRRVIKALEDEKRINLAYRRLNRPEDLTDELLRWGQSQHSGYRIGYLALHGSPESVYIGRRSLSWDDMAAAAGRSLQGKHLHFGSCEVMATEPARREEFRRALGLRSLSGFTRQVDWFESLAFELMLFDALTYYTRIDAVERYLRDVAGSLWDKKGFVLTRNRGR